MAEAFLNRLFGDRYRASSGGTEPTSINPNAIAVMKELGYDLSGNRAKSVDDFLGEKFDLVVTLCSEAEESCPFIPGARAYEHHEFRDPGSCQGSENEVLDCVRRIRDEIREWVETRFKD